VQGLHQLSECQMLADPITFVPVFIMCSEFAVTIAQFVSLILIDACRLNIGPHSMNHSSVK
jgi:hypothetical protein